MKPAAAVQILLQCDSSGKVVRVLGSCFRLWSKKHFITAAHCVDSLEPIQIQVMNCLDDDKDLRCSSIYRHPRADIAIIEVDEVVPEKFEQLELCLEDFHFGPQIHCFGVVCDSNGSLNELTQRIVGGIIQRSFIFKEGKYESRALELSVPIPKGMSGGPAFIAANDRKVVGVAIATVISEVVVSSIEEYQIGDKSHKDRISEIIRYGVILKLLTIRDWLEKIMPQTTKVN